ncbi:MAG: ribonuclease P protein component, partial [Acidimicrobiales bacterium]
RNRLRRRLRALWREATPPGGDYLIVAAPAAATATHAELARRLSAALDRLAVPA